MGTEKVIVTLTSFGKRLPNLPVVLNTIFNQTVLPDRVVINLAHYEMVSDAVLHYLNQHDVEINRVPDTKVYKKLIPTLKRYPEDCVISIDDDFLYPNDMISDFLTIHRKYPQFPISGNRVVHYGMQCHCGCASLTKAEYFGDYLSQIDTEVIENCPSDDMVYTFLSTKACHPYIHTENEYFYNMPSCFDGDQEGYSANVVGEYGVKNTYQYLVNRFGIVSYNPGRYLCDDYLSTIVGYIEELVLEDMLKRNEINVEHRVRSTYAYRLGSSLLKPVRRIKKLIRGK